MVTRTAMQIFNYTITLLLCFTAPSFATLPVQSPPPVLYANCEASAEFFPEITPLQTGYLTVSTDPLHQIYFEEVGNPHGKPVVLLHGGPGSYIAPVHRRFFDPKKYRIILFSQRGSDKSKPLGELRDNTTQHLVEDIEKLRVHFGIEKWQVFGGSWGATLGLAYAQTHPTRVTELVLRGIYLGRNSEAKWLNEAGGSGQLYPREFERYSSFIPEAERANLIAAYYKRVMDPDPRVHVPAAIEWNRYESSIAKTQPLPLPEPTEQEIPGIVAGAKILIHYFVNSVFLEHDELLRRENIDRIRQIPTVIVQGQNDVVVPPTSAWDLHKAWPEAQLVMVPGANHSATEPGIRSELIKATNAFCP